MDGKTILILKRFYEINRSAKTRNSRPKISKI